MLSLCKKMVPHLTQMSAILIMTFFNNNVCVLYGQAVMSMCIIQTSLKTSNWNYKLANMDDKNLSKLDMCAGKKSTKIK